MLRIFVYYIAKTKDLGDEICKNFIPLCSPFNAKLEFVNLFCKSIKEGQKNDAKEAQKSYSKEFIKVFKSNQYKIALSPNGKMLDSKNFANLLKDKLEVAFFIGGAYGLEESFVKDCETCVSLSELTFSHKIAKIVLSEQIYRSLGLLNNHPYHK